MFNDKKFLGHTIFLLFVGLFLMFFYVGLQNDHVNILIPYLQANYGWTDLSITNPVTVAAFVGIALYLRNVWVWVHYARLSTPRRGRRKLNLAVLPFKTLMMWLARFAEQSFGVNEHVIAMRAP